MTTNVKSKKLTNFWSNKLPSYKVKPAAQHHMKQSKHFIKDGIVAGASMECSCGMSGDCQCSYSCASDD